MRDKAKLMAEHRARAAKLAAKASQIETVIDALDAAGCPDPVRATSESLHWGGSREGWDGLVTVQEDSNLATFEVIRRAILNTPPGEPPTPATPMFSQNGDTTGDLSEVAAAFVAAMEAQS